MVSWNRKQHNAVIVGGVRTPFVKAGGPLKRVHVAELARVAMHEVLYRSGYHAERLDEVIMGNVVMPADATNPARVAALWAGVPDHVPALTVQRNCASGMEAIAQAAARIETGRCRSILAGGAESMSRAPLMFPERAAEPFSKMARARTLPRRVMALASMRPTDFSPVSALQQGLTDPTCGMIMGKTAEVLAHEFGIAREDQDMFALQSHLRALRAIEDGRLDKQIVPCYPNGQGKKYGSVTLDVGPREGQSLEALGALRPLFDRRDGTVTVGNACQITDGAVAMLVMDSDHAKAERIQPLATVKGYATAALDPARMGLGPVHAIDRLLQQTGVSLDNIGVFEINEAFAAQVLACQKAMASEMYCRQHLGRGKLLGAIDPDKLNVSGGAIALGHPVGATGSRLVLNLIHEMHRLDVELGLAALCVGGGQGAAILFQRS